MEYDRDNSGYMTFEEMPSLLRELGLPLDEPTLKKYVEVVLIAPAKGLFDAENGLSPDDFVHLYRAVLTSQPAAVRKRILESLRKRVTSEAKSERYRVREVNTQAQDLRQKFAFYDTDGSGFLEMEEIAQVMADLGILDIDGDGHEEFLVRTLAKMDMNNDNRVNYAEFVYFLNSAIEHAP